MVFSIIWIAIFIIVGLLVAFHLLKFTFGILKKTLFVLLFVLLLYVVVAHAQQQLFSGFVYDSSSITVGNKYFTINFEPNPQDIMLTSGSDLFFIDVGTCKYVYNFEFCFNNAIYDLNARKYEASITIFSAAPTITIVRTIDNPTLNVGDQATISVLFKNTQGIAAENVNYTDSFTPDFKITDVSFCSTDGTNVYWYGRLRENDTVQCEYTIEPLKDMERLFKAKLSYFDGTQNQDIFSSPIDLKVNPLLRVTTQFNETDRIINVGDGVSFIVNMTNVADEDMSVNYLDFYLPQGLQFLDIGSVQTANGSIGSKTVSQVGANLYRFSGTLKKNQSALVVLNFEGTNVGSSDILIYGDYTKEDIEGTLQLKDSVQVQAPAIDISTNLNDGQTFDVNQETWLKLYLTNLNPSTKIRNVIVHFNTSFAQIPDLHIDQLNESESSWVLNQHIITPSVSSPTAFPLHIIVNYTTEFGEQFSKELDLTFHVEPAAGLTITHTLSKTTVESGESFDVTTQIKNERNADVKGIKVFDITDMGFQREGVSSVTLDINALDTVTAYRYTLIAPDVMNQTRFLIRTNAKIFENNATLAYEREDYVTVKPKQLNIDITRTLDDTNVFEGKVLNLNYQLTNTETVRLKNIRLTLPLQQNFDVIGDRTYLVEKLDPGETLTLDGKQQVRPKDNVSVVLNPTEMTYDDEEGRHYEKNSSSMSMSVKYSYISGPAFVIEKNVSRSKINLSDSVDVNLTVLNVGSERGTVDVVDGDRSWNFVVEPKGYARTKYTVTPDTNGTISLGTAVGNYSYIGKNLLTESNEPVVVVLPPAVAQVEQPKPIAANATVAPQAPAQKNIFQRIYDWIQGIVAMIRTV